MRLYTILRQLLPSLLLVACASEGGKVPALATHAQIDLGRYMGTWHVIANVPYFGERGNVASKDVYALDADGNVATTYVYKKAFDAADRTLSSVGIVQPQSDNARWVVRFFWLLRADYLILEVAPDYSWALIGQPGRKLGWVLARAPDMSDETYLALLRKFEGYGYRAAAFKRVAQFPGQVGREGFQ